MSFDEVQFPTDISYGAVGGPVYNVDVVTTSGGAEQRVNNWSAPLSRYNVSHGVKSETQLHSLLDFFRARAGKVRGFRFKDHTDYQAIGQVIGIGDDVEVNFQLVKNYTSGPSTETRAIKKPVAGTTKIYFDLVEQVSGWSIDTTTGIVTFSAAPESGVSITADCEFDVPVRFDVNDFQGTVEGFGTYAWNDITLVELRRF